MAGSGHRAEGVTMPFLIFVGGLLLALYCLVDLLPRPDSEIVGLPKVLWVVVVLFFPLLGGLAYLLVGRSGGPTDLPYKGNRGVTDRWRSGPTAGFPEYERPGGLPARGPEDDAAFQARMRARIDEQRRRAAEQHKRDDQG